MAAGYEDGQIKIWDLKTTSLICQNKIDDGGITNLYLNSDGKLMIVCGLKTGAVVLKTNDCKIAANLLSQDNDEIETGAFCSDPELPLVATGRVLRLVFGVGVIGGLDFR